PWRTARDGEIGSLDIMRRKHGGKRGMRGFGLCRDHDARCVLVETMNDAWAGDAANTGETRTAMMEQGIDQRAALLPGGRVNHHPGGLVDDDEVFVFEQDVERYGFGLRLCVRRRRRIDDINGARDNLGAWIGGGGAVGGDAAVLDQRA